MKKKALWLVVSLLMVLSLVLASCAPAAPAEEKPAPPAEEKPEKPTPAPPEEEEEVAKGPEMVKDSLGRLVEKPRYGGVFNYGGAAEPLIFDEFYGLIVYASTLFHTNEHLLQGDWMKGPAGTGDALWVQFPVPSLDIMTGQLAESWELVDDQTMVFHIRKGVYFHDKPPTNGREMTADDVVFSLNRLWESPQSYHSQVFPWDAHFESITAPDKWTVVFKSKPGLLGTMYECCSLYGQIVPREVVDMYGSLKDWRNSCGTGPFMLVDYVTGSTATLKRHPNYWQKDPLHPDNQLPYVDMLKILIIPDYSTRLAAIRTGKLDWLGGLSQAVGWEDAQSLIETDPELEYLRFLHIYPPTLYGRLDTQPFDDIRVRRALSMAINRQEIIENYYGGDAEILGFPVMPIPEFKDVYVPLEKMPDSVQELYKYNPEKAKQLLAEAGYPDGFQTNVYCTAPSADFLAIIKAYFEDIGVDLEIRVKEYGVFVSIGRGRAYEQMYYSTPTAVIPFRFVDWLPGNYQNYSLIDDPKIKEAALEVKKAYFDLPKRNQVYKDIVPYMLDQCYMIPIATPYVYTFWQPWIKAYHGEFDPGYMGDWHNFIKYVWLDLDMKEQMTGGR